MNTTIGLRALAIGFGSFLAVSNANSAMVSLQNATATFSQNASTFSIARAVDGDESAGGWAIAIPIDPLNPGADRTQAQTAVFETATNLNIVPGTDLTFTLKHLFTTVPQHSIGKFRLSVTTDDRTLFADGLASNGDVTANWSVLTPLTALSQGGATMTINGDGSVLVSGSMPMTDTYTISAQSSAQGITGFRLEVIEDASLPTSGPGRQPDNGNFVLTEFTVGATLAPVPEPATWIMMAAGLGFVLLGAQARRRSPS